MLALKLQASSESSDHVIGQFFHCCTPFLQPSNNSVTPCTRCHRILWVNYVRRYIYQRFRMLLTPSPCQFIYCSPTLNSEWTASPFIHPRTTYVGQIEIRKHCGLESLDTQRKLMFVTPTTIIAPYDIKQGIRSVYLHP